MADFKAAFEKTLAHEGGYVDDPADKGGETYKGISRRYHPYWPWWEIIDAKKNDPDFPASLMNEKLLNMQVEHFYKEHFWDRLLGDEIPSQAVAEELFDTAVNMGVGQAVKFLQQALNFLNRNERLFPDLVDDGVIGQVTLTAFQKLPKRDHGVLLKIMNVLQGMHYINFMRKSPTQERFCRGWLERVEIKKLEAPRTLKRDLRQS